MPDSLYRDCPGCGTKFLAHHSQQIYCSKDCQLVASAPIRQCEHCGKSFPATQEYKGFTRKTCSPQCTGLAKRAKTLDSYPSKEEVVRLYVHEGLTDRELGQRFGHTYQWSLNVRRHHGIPGRSRDSWMRKPLHKKRDRGRWAISMKREPACRNCGGQDKLLHLHHAVPRSHSPAGKYDLRNGLPLCHVCHTGWHSMGMNIYRDVFTDDEWAFVQTLTGGEWLDRRYPVRPADGGTLQTRYCRRGHLLEGHNLSVLKNGKRRCKTCANLRTAEYRARKKAAEA